AVVVVLGAGDWATTELSPWAWLFLIVGVDVAHVYSTLYRTYLDKKMRSERRMLLWTTPLLAWGIGAMLYSLGAMVFWRGLAYLAVFHFVRQQYGFMRIYSRKQKQSRLFNSIDITAIYTATIYPLLYWHFTGSHKNFNWFVNGDFVLSE